MSIFNELLPKFLEAPKNAAKSVNEQLEAVLARFDKFEEEYLKGRANAKAKSDKDKTLLTTLQSINEDDDEPNKAAETKPDNQDKDNEKTESSRPRRVSKKRSKDEVEGMLSPEQDKRLKRNASVKALTNISKQVNVNLTQKLRREDSSDTKSRRHKDNDKENAEPTPVLQIKQEKVSLPPEPMELECLPAAAAAAVKQEPSKDDMAMPPPAAPVPKSRRAAQKEKDKEAMKEETITEEPSRGRRSARARKQTDTLPPPPVPSARSTRASSRASARAATLAGEPAPADTDTRPKRTRAKKKVSEQKSTEDETPTPPEVTPVASPAEKPRPKRTRRGKNAEKETSKPEEPKEPPKPEEPSKPVETQTAVETQTSVEPELISPKKERISQPENAVSVDSPVLQKPKKNAKKQQKDDKKQKQEIVKQKSEETVTVLDETDNVTNNNMNMTVTINKEMDKTMVLPNGVYNHVPNMCGNETVVLESNVRETMVLEPTSHINDATVVIEKDPKAVNITDDNSLLTDDGSETHTPPRPVPPPQPSSAVKDKVQQFEELAARTTRTKTRAMAKKDEDNHTPPDKMIKPVLSQETLNKMNNMIFNGKPPQVSASACKPPSIPPPTKLAASASKLSALGRLRDAADDLKNDLKRERDDARKKKEALLEAKRELQRKKREEKMANAAAAREAAERERRLAMEAATRERAEKQLHADLGKMERLKEVERKKHELARKVAETEERRRAEEQARQQRLAEEQRKAEAARRKQLEEAESMKKEAALMAKEIEKRQKEYLDKQKKHRLESDKGYTPLKGMSSLAMGGYSPLPPVYMADGFQYLNSDEDSEPPPCPVPAWSTSKKRKETLSVQSQLAATHIDKLFWVRVHSPDLRAIFPSIERARLKRTSSAVWRTPPRLPPVNE